MAKGIKIGNLAKAVEKELGDYGILVGMQMQKVTEQIGEETAERITETAPRKTGKYAKTWVSDTNGNGRTSHSVVVHAEAPGYRLAHLLEKGHQKRNGGRTRAMPHIAPAEQEAADKIVKELRKRLE